MWFWKSKKFQSSFSATLLRKVFSPVLKLERAVTQWTNNRTQHWGRPQQLVFLFCVCTLLGASSLLLFFQKSGQPPSAPTSFYPTLYLNDLHGSGGYSLNAVDSAIVSQFILVADSLLLTKEGKTYLLQFFSERPGFLDSLEIMRPFYPGIPNFKKELYEP